jgi:hypothetical protein
MVYNASTYLKLNNYGFSDDNIEIVKEYLRTRKLPESIDNSGKKNVFYLNGKKISRLRMIN